MLHRTVHERTERSAGKWLAGGSGRGPDPLPPEMELVANQLATYIVKTVCLPDWLGCGEGDAQDDGLQAAEAFGEARAS